MCLIPSAPRNRRSGGWTKRCRGSAAAAERQELLVAVAECREGCLVYGADLTARQIADVLELKVNAVEVGLHRALARLRENLESEGIGAAAELLASL